LYFASQGHLGFGGFDVFFSRQNDDGTWGEPVNLGHPINTEEDEHGFVVSTDGKMVYYASSHIGGKRTLLNVLSFELYKEAQPDKVVLVKGTVDQENTSTGPKKVEIKNMSSKKVNTFDVEESDGSFAAIMTVKPGDKVVMKVKGEEVAYNSRLIEVPDEKTLDSIPAGTPVSQNLDVKVEREEVGKPYRLEDIHYETNSAEISDRSKVILDDFAEYLIERKELNVAIHGHTDNVGREAENLALSTDRAYSVKAYLEAKGVASADFRLKDLVLVNLCLQTAPKRVALKTDVPNLYCSGNNSNI
jgi:outer membrane protein OmpA-like peptidoglycan-associated protein